ncbi:hypothetical protein IC582_024207 [Cucumis melo]
MAPHLLFLDLDRATKKIIGRGYESGGLYLFDHQVPQAVACLVVPSPFEVHCHLGFRYFVTFVDDHSLSTLLYSMKNLSELLAHFCAFHAEIKNQFNVSIKTLRTDNAGEYFSHTLGSYLCEHGIIHQSSCADTPSQNGVAERKNMHLLEIACALSFQMHVPKTFWADAVSTTCFLINRMPSSILNGEIPYLVTFPTKSLFPIALKIFGCVCFVRDVRPHHTKLDPKSLKYIFLGYSRVQKRYRCYCPTLKRYLVSFNIAFFRIRLLLHHH